MSGVARLLAIDCSVVATERSSTVPRVGVRSFASKDMKSKRWPRTKTLADRSPAPPEIGWLWQPLQEFDSGPDRRLLLRGKRSGEFGSDSGAPVPLVVTGGLRLPAK